MTCSDLENHTVVRCHTSDASAYTLRSDTGEIGLTTGIDSEQGAASELSGGVVKREGIYRVCIGITYQYQSMRADVVQWAAKHTLGEIRLPEEAGRAGRDVRKQHDRLAIFAGLESVIREVGTKRQHE